MSAVEDKRASWRESSRKYNAANKAKETARKMAWRANNKANVAATKAKRYAAETCAAPPWLTASDRKNILGFYMMRDRLTACLGV